MFLYTNNKIAESDIKETVLFTTASKRIPRNKFTKEVRDLYSENYKLLIKEIENGTVKWKDKTDMDCKNYYY